MKSTSLAALMVVGLIVLMQAPDEADANCRWRWRCYIRCSWGRCRYRCYVWRQCYRSSDAINAAPPTNDNDAVTPSSTPDRVGRSAADGGVMAETDVHLLRDFPSFDDDQDGFVTATELATELNVLVSEAAEAVATADADHDGRLSKEEFEKLKMGFQDEQ